MRGVLFFQSLEEILVSAGSISPAAFLLVAILLRHFSCGSAPAVFFLRHFSSGISLKMRVFFTTRHFVRHFYKKCACGISGKMVRASFFWHVGSSRDIQPVGRTDSRTDGDNTQSAVPRACTNRWRARRSREILVHIYIYISILYDI